MTEHDDRLADLEARVHALEERNSPSPASDTAPGEAGTIGYQGAVDLCGDVAWTIRYDAAATLDLAPGGITTVLAALGNPVRLQIVRTLLRGPAAAAELQESVGLSSAGQLYHHLKALTGARIVEQESRNRYFIPATKVVPLMIITLAGADVSEQLG